MTALEEAVAAAEETGTAMAGAAPADWYLHVARAVLMAVREPSLAIQDAGWEAAINNGACTPECCWVAMIDQLLSEGMQ